jgi:hypothetical protein
MLAASAARHLRESSVEPGCDHLGLDLAEGHVPLLFERAERRRAATLAQPPECEADLVE